MSGNWTTFDFRNTDTDFSHLPKGPGVYAIYVEGELRYIGQSMSVRNRIISHGFRFFGYSASVKTPHGSSVTLVIKVRRSNKYGDWLMIEHRLIRRLSPRGNARCVKGRSVAAMENWSADDGRVYPKENRPGCRVGGDQP